MKAGAQTQPNENESQILEQPLGLKKVLADACCSDTSIHFPNCTVFIL